MVENMGFSFPSIGPASLPVMAPVINRPVLVTSPEPITPAGTPSVGPGSILPGPSGPIPGPGNTSGPMVPIGPGGIKDPFSSMLPSWLSMRTTKNLLQRINTAKEVTLPKPAPVVMDDTGYFERQADAEKNKNLMKWAMIGGGALLTAGLMSAGA